MSGFVLRFNYLVSAVDDPTDGENRVAPVCSPAWRNGLTLSPGSVQITPLLHRFGCAVVVSGILTLHQRPAKAARLRKRGTDEGANFQNGDEGKRRQAPRQRFDPHDILPCFHSINVRVQHEFDNSSKWIGSV